MKRLVLLLFMTITSYQSYAQVGIGINPPDANAMLDVRSTTKGLLPPRLSAAQRTTLATSLSATQTGMTVADATSGQLFYWTGTAWRSTAYTGTSPINVNAATNTVALNAGTAVGDLITWDGNNWINTQPAVQHFSVQADNMQPYLVVNYCIAVQGVFPSPSSGPNNDTYLGEIQMFGFNFAPNGYAMCNGQLLPIAQNAALFSLLGTMYGGNGATTFALPDLRGRVPMHLGQGSGLSNRVQGESSGVENTTVTR